MFHVELFGECSTWNVFQLAFCELQVVPRETAGSVETGGKQQVWVHLLARIRLGGWALFAGSKGGKNPEK